MKLTSPKIISKLFSIRKYFPKKRNSTVKSNLIQLFTSQQTLSHSSKEAESSDTISESTSTVHIKKNLDGCTILGHYEILHKLKNGRQGVVFLGVDSGENFAALKIIERGYNDEKKDKCIRNEILSMKSIAHPNVLRLHDVMYDVQSHTSNIPFERATVLVLDYCRGGDFFEIITESGPMSERLARTYFQQLLHAVNACHDMNIVHRDIKLQNILLDENFNLKLTDFGVCAVKSDNDDICKTMCGTLSYMAPEIIRKLLYSGKKADSWNVGVVLFILLTGHPPMKLASVNDWWYRCIKSKNLDRFWSSHQVSSPTALMNARNIIERFLEPNALNRCSIKDALLDPWLRGPTLSPVQLTEQMNSRINIIHRNKLL